VASGFPEMAAPLSRGVAQLPGVLTIKNTQRHLPVDVAAIRKYTEWVRQFVNCSRYDLGLWFCGPQTIRRYNRDMRGHDKVTDVLSIPLVGAVVPGQPPPPIMGEPPSYDLGSIMLCPAYIEKSLADLEWETEAEDAPPASGLDALHCRYVELIVHGTCHLLGHTHDHDRDYERMSQHEDAIWQFLKDNVAREARSRV
jgi:rRNA maturation RNase YbeY